MQASDRVFHRKFGNGNVILVDGNKLTIRFDKESGCDRRYRENDSKIRGL
jgi:hypothetical protein